MKCDICDESATFRTHCGHNCCNDCFAKHFTATLSYPVQCFKCPTILKDEECLQNLSLTDKETFKKYKKFLNDYLNKFLHKCYDLECSGEFYDYDKNSDDKFVCPKCSKVNCLKCAALHKEGETCKMWRLDNKDIIRERKKQIRQNEEKIKARNGMYCVKCETFCERVGGCYGLRCPLCKTDLCIITQQARWGSEGYGDESGGCQCSNFRLCHPECKGCIIDYATFIPMTHYEILERYRQCLRIFKYGRLRVS